MSDTKQTKPELVAQKESGQGQWAWLSRSAGFRALTALIGVLLLGCIFNADSAFFGFKTHQDLLGAVAINGMLACGMTIVILTAGIDLSVGSVLGVTAMCFPLFTLAYGWPAWMAITCCLAIGAAAGAVNGLLITCFGMQPFVATLAMMASARGLAKFVPVFAGLGPARLGELTPNQKIQPKEGLGPPIFSKIDGSIELWDAEWGTVQLPILTIILLFCVAVVWVIVSQTRFGRHLYAIGGNEESARLSGIRVGLNKVAAYAMSGLTAGLAGICYAARARQGDPQAGETYELKAIAAVVIGGTSLMGGRGGVLLTLMGVLIIGYIEKILSLNGVQEHGRLMIQGAIIVAAVVIQRRRG
jgi:ribose transport system permease protein